MLTGILTILRTRAPPPSTSSLSSSSDSFAFTPSDDFHSCSPANLSAQTGAAVEVEDGLIQVTGAHYVSSPHGRQVTVPTANTYTVTVRGTGLGQFTLILDTSTKSGGNNETVFLRVPVLSTSRGSLEVTSRGIGSFLYDYIGDGTTDAIPPDITPPTIQCTGGYFFVQGFRASVSFDIGLLRCSEHFCLQLPSSSYGTSICQHEYFSHIC